MTTASLIMSLIALIFSAVAIAISLGIKENRGAQGEQGPMGERGEKGEIGYGRQGEPGPQGPAGPESK